MVLTDVAIEQNDNQFHISFYAHHKRNEIDFGWKGVITGYSDGSLSFSMEGKGYSTFKRNRIGFCILHPLPECKGQRVLVETPEGEKKEGKYPVTIAPYQPFLNVGAIHQPIKNDLVAIMRFSGDIFEMEDQRNWTDATYKTYSTPQSLPSPVVLEEGESIYQSVQLSFNKTPEPIKKDPHPEVSTIHITVPDSLKAMPAIGLESTEFDIQSGEVQKLLQDIRLNHLRLDLMIHQPANEKVIRQMMELLEKTGTRAELVLHCSNQFESELHHLGIFLHHYKPGLHQCIIFRDDEKIVSKDTMVKARSVLAEYIGDVPVGSGSEYYFVDCNRNHPPIGSIDFICYSVTPQVHTFDNAAIMENLPGQKETLETAKQWAPDKPIAVTPVTLRPRKRPGLPQKDGGPDSRLQGLFGAAWTVGSIAYCIDGGASSITYHKTSGPGGIMSFDGSVVYPVYHLFAAMGSFDAEKAAMCTSSDLSKVTGFVLMDENGNRRIVLSNCTAMPQEITLHGLTSPVRYGIIDETNYEQLLSDYQWYTSLETRQKEDLGKCKLLPFGILIIDEIGNEQEAGGVTK